MQYVIKVSVENTESWRLLALDGKADRAHVALLISASFDLAPGTCSFCVNGTVFTAGDSGEAVCTQDLTAFDDFKLESDDVFYFKASSNSELSFRCSVMKAESRLYCLVPSCLVGSGPLSLNTENSDLTAKAINEYIDSDDFAGLDLKKVTAKLRAFGGVRKDINKSMVQAGAVPLNFKVE